MTHTRSILFLKGRYWVMRDRVSGEGTHRYDLRFHFSADASPFSDEQDGARAVRESWDEKSGLEIFVFGGGGRWIAEEGLISAGYGQRTTAPVYNFSATAEGEQEFLTLLMPQVPHRAKTVVQESSLLARGRLFEIEQTNWRDSLLVGDGSLIDTERFSSDFQLAWARFAKDGGLEELVLIGGRRFFLNGRALFESARPTGYVFARRTGDELLLETDAKETSRLPLPDGEVSESRVYSF
jgi:hypothetical protein